MTDLLISVLARIIYCPCQLTGCPHLACIACKFAVSTFHSAAVLYVE